MALDGINRLIAVTQMKSNSANEDALRGAAQQRALIGQQKQLRAVQRSFQELARDEQQRALMELQSRLPGFRQTLSPAAAALLDQWVEWAGQQR